MLEWQGKLAEALADYGRGIQLAPRLARAWQQRGFLQLAIGNTTEAQRDLAVAQRLDPGLSAIATFDSRDVVQVMPGKERLARRIKRVLKRR